MEHKDGAEESNIDPVSSHVVNVTPAFLSTCLSSAKFIVETYGWLLLIAVLLVVYLYHIYKPSYIKWKRKQLEFKESEEAKKNPDRGHTIQLAMEESRLRLQERVSIDSKVKRTKEEEIANQKRQEKFEEWEKHKEGKGYHSKSSKKFTDNSTGGGNQQLKPNKKKSELRPSFNPLSGDSGGSSGYRPSARSNGGGG